MLIRVRIPGGAPGISASDALAIRAGNATGRSGSFFNNLGCGKTGADTTQQSDRRCAVCCLLQQFPSSKGQDSGPSIRGCRFNSGRERQWIVIPAHAGIQRRSQTLDHRSCGDDVKTPTRCSAAASAPRSAWGDRGFESFRRDHTPVAQRMQSARSRPVRSRVRFLPGVPFANDAVTQRPECSPVEREVAGSSPASVANELRRVTQQEE